MQPTTCPGWNFSSAEDVQRAGSIAHERYTHMRDTRPRFARKPTVTATRLDTSGGVRIWYQINPEEFFGPYLTAGQAIAELDRRGAKDSVGLVAQALARLCGWSVSPA